MRKILWSRKAAEDLKTIYRFYSVQSENAAFTIYQQIRTETKLLRNFPYLAPIEQLLCDKPG